MKKLLVTIIVLLSWHIAIGQDAQALLNDARTLIENKKYDSAFKMLNQADPENANPSVVLLKEEIALNYFVSSIMHQMFGLRDLAPDENIYELRGQEGTSSMYSFPINDILDTLIMKYPDNYKLHKGLAEYYYQVHLDYGNNWLKPETEVLELVQKNYQTAIAHNEADFLSYYVLGYIALLNKKYEESVPFFIASIKLNDKYASSYYNMSYANLMLNDTVEALRNAKKSLELYNDSKYKSDAAIMVATVYAKQGNTPKMTEYYEVSNNIAPGNYYTLYPLLASYVKSGSEKMDATVKDFFELDPENPTIYNDLYDIYTQFDKPDHLIVFFKSQLDNYSQNPIVSGSLYFYLGRIYRSTDKNSAIEYFIKARESFAKVYEPDHQAFGIIEKALKQLE